MELATPSVCPSSRRIARRRSSKSLARRRAAQACHRVRRAQLVLELLVNLQALAEIGPCRLVVALQEGQPAGHDQRVPPCRALLAPRQSQELRQALPPLRNIASGLP